MQACSWPNKLLHHNRRYEAPAYLQLKACDSEHACSRYLEFLHNYFTQLQNKHAAYFTAVRRGWQLARQTSTEGAHCHQIDGMLQHFMFFVSAAGCSMTKIVHT